MQPTTSPVTLEPAPTQWKSLTQILDETSPELDDNQRMTIQGIVQRVESGDPVTVVVTGYAGTGKSVILSAVAKYLTQPPKRRPPPCSKHDDGEKGADCTCPGVWVVATPTHKAAGVLSRKGVESVRTLHSILTTPKVEECSLEEADVLFQKVRSGDKLTEREESIAKPVFKPKSGGKPLAGIIVDESSMVTHDLSKMIQERDVPVVFFGDAGQLPPVDVNNPNFSVLTNPDFTLDTVYRNDGNILALSIHLREGGRATAFAKCSPKNDIVVTTRHSDAKSFSPDVVLAWKNSTVYVWNEIMRAKRGYVGKLPQPGDLIVFERGIPGTDVHKADTAKVTYAIKSGRNSVMTSFVSDMNGKSYDADLDLNYFLVPKPEADMRDIVTCNYDQWMESLEVARKARTRLSLNDVVPIDLEELAQYRFGKQDEEDQLTAWIDWKRHVTWIINKRQRELSEKLRPTAGSTQESERKFINMVRDCRTLRLYMETISANMQTAQNHTVNNQIMKSIARGTFNIANPDGAVPARFGYAMTVHKSQGSEFNKVLFIQDMSQTHAQFTKLAYTAVTRAKSELMYYIA